MILEDIKKLKETECLYYYDGPVISVLNNDHILIWCEDLDYKKFTRKYCFNITKKNLKNFKENNLTLLDAIKKASNIYIFEVSYDEEKWENFKKISFNELKKLDYLPKEGVFLYAK